MAAQPGRRPRPGSAPAERRDRSMQIRSPTAAALLCAIVVALASGDASARACSREAHDAHWTPPAVLDAGGGTLTLDALIARLAMRKVVLVGELHDRYAHHLNQLEIICRLRAHGPLAIGLEFFDTGAQRVLDDYVQRHGDLDRLLRESRWFERWGVDPRLYAPILRHARAHRIALVALNVPGDLVRQVARGGMQSLDAAARARLPASMLAPSAAYRARLRAAFEQHPGHEQRAFAPFVAAQSLWDEGMAQRAAEHLLAHPHQRLVVLAGEAHVAHLDAIPQRLARRVNVPLARVLQAPESGALPAGAFDFRLRSAAHELPPAGRLGVRLDHGTAVIGELGERSAARDAGLRVGDRLLALDGHAVTGLAELRLALWQRRPADAVRVTFERAGRVHRIMFALQ